MLSEKQKTAKNNLQNAIAQLILSFTIDLSGTPSYFARIQVVKNKLEICTDSLPLFYSQFYKKTDSFMDDMAEIRFHLCSCEKAVSNAKNAIDKGRHIDITANLLAISLNHAHLAKTYLKNLSTEDCN